MAGGETKQAVRGGFGAAVVVGAVLGLLACAAAPPPSLRAGASPGDGPLSACPSSPNCVSSMAVDADHIAAALTLAAPVDKSWQEAIAVVASMPRSTIVARSPVYLRAEFRSLLLRFVDDLELLLDPRTGRVQVRSASRTGYSDMGVNRRRVEDLQRLLRQRGVLQAGAGPASAPGTK